MKIPSKICLLFERHKLVDNLGNEYQCCLYYYTWAARRISSFALKMKKVSNMLLTTQLLPR